MFNLLVKGRPWADGHALFGSDRVITYTDPILKEKYVSNNEVDFEALKKLPALFVEETRYDLQQFARIGRITNVRKQRFEVVVEYSFDVDYAPIPQELIIKLKGLLHLEFPNRGFDELCTTHWAVKDVDLFRILCSSAGSSARTPTVFSVPQYQTVNSSLLSVMMPFAGFTAVYEAIQSAAKITQMNCLRADNVWEHATIIQDVVSIIDKAAIIICDCTNRNANVFYEIGISHALGKEVILITQSKNDIPFDLIHHRYITYLPNSEGLNALAMELVGRINTLQNR